MFLWYFDIFCWHAIWCLTASCMIQYANVQCETFRLNSNCWCSKLHGYLSDRWISTAPRSRIHPSGALSGHWTLFFCFTMSSGRSNVNVDMKLAEIRKSRWCFCGNCWEGGAMSPYITQQHSEYLRSLIFATIVGGGLQGQAAWIYKKAI